MGTDWNSPLVTFIKIMKQYFEKSTLFIYPLGIILLVFAIVELMAVYMLESTHGSTAEEWLEAATCSYENHLTCVKEWFKNS